MISFIIPAHDEARLLAATLAAIRVAAGAQPCGHEIIVVADACTDDTARIATDGGARVVIAGHRHIAASRNAGAREAIGDLLIFVDADTLVDAIVVGGALAVIERGAIGGGAAVRLQGPLAWYEQAAESFFVWMFRVTRIAPGCFLFCSRSAFDAVGGFNQRYYAGEDVAMSRALAAHGRFVMLRAAVRTSARKLRTFTLGEHLGLALRFTLRGRRMLHSQRDLDLWYGRRRDERQ